MIIDPDPELPAAAAAAAAGVRVSLSEVLSALSRALDLTEGQPAGHTVRSCAIALRLGNEIGLDEAQRTALYYGVLLKDAGCSSNASRMAALFGTADGAAKSGMKLVDWDRPVALAWQTLRTAGRGRGLGARFRHFARIARTPDITRTLIQIRCERGADIVAGLGFPTDAAETVRCLDEHWNGGGHPRGLRGDEVPLLARIANLAQTTEMFFAAHGRDAALRAVRQRRGSWFEPALADRVLRWRRDDAWWERLASPTLETWVVDAEPGDRAREVDEAGLDGIARAFAEIIDAKSPYTFRHSFNVAELAVGAAEQMGMDAAELRRARRAGLLHDIGKLGISSRILDKNGPLTPDERAEVERHPAYGWEILRRVGAFSDFAWPASLHHEKLDGSGYPWRLAADQLDPLARVLAVADIFEALTADRPYRAGMGRDAALDIIRRDVPARLSAEALAALEAATAESTLMPG